MKINIRELYSAGFSRPAVLALQSAVEVASSLADGTPSGTTAAGIKTSYESNANTNAFSDLEKTKLAAIETAATADQSAAEILAGWESASGLDDANLVVVSGARAFTGPPILPSYAAASPPSAATYVRGIIYVPDEAGGATLAFSDGTNWRRVQDRAVVS